MKTVSSEATPNPTGGESCLSELVFDGAACDALKASGTAKRGLSSIAMAVESNLVFGFAAGIPLVFRLDALGAGLA